MIFARRGTRKAAWTGVAMLVLTMLGPARPVAGQATGPLSLEQELLAESLATLTAQARERGDAQRGAIAFYQPHLTCTKCHTAGEGASPLGPDLARLTKDITAEHLVQSLLRPSESIADEYRAYTVILQDGRTVSGLLEQETDELLVLRDINTPEKCLEIRRQEIDVHRQEQQSIMPTGLVNQLTGRQQFLDLARYLIEIAEGGPQRAKELKPPESLYAPPPAAPDTSRPELQVYRTMMPQSGPASFAIGLGDDIWVCFDPQRGGINYAWQGRLDLAPTLTQKINEPAQVEGTIFYRETIDRPWRLGERDRLPQLKFRGYRFLGENVVELHYQLDGVTVRERLERLRDGDQIGLRRHITFESHDRPLWRLEEPEPTGRVTFDTGRQTMEQGASRIELDTSGAITMTIEPSGSTLSSEGRVETTGEAP